VQYLKLQKTTGVKIISYFLYGSRAEYKLELALSVFSALGQEALHAKEHPAEKITYCVITDQDDLGYSLPVEVLHLEREELARWTENGAYNHRAKPLATLKLLDHYKCPVAMIDTDTFFTDSPHKIFERISSSNSVMHAFEYSIGDQPIWSKLLQMIDGEITINGYTVQTRSPMFNSGVIGLTAENQYLLKDAIEVIDRLYALDPVFNIEQFAIGLTLSTKTKLHICSDIVRHYWGPERDFVRIQATRFLNEFSSCSSEEKIAAIAKEKFGPPSIPFRFKLLARLMGLFKRWSDTQRFAFICRLCERHCALTDPEYSQVWGKLGKQNIH
jgi:hypothetical protein